MPPRGSKESALGLLSLIAWVPAILTGALVLPWLPAWMPGRPPPPGMCYFAGNLVVFIDCQGALADRIFSKILNFACYWTFGVQWMAVVMPPMILVSLLSVCFALRFLTSKFAPAEQ